MLSFRAWLMMTGISGYETNWVSSPATNGRWLAGLRLEPVDELAADGLPHPGLVCPDWTYDISCVGKYPRFHEIGDSLDRKIKNALRSELGRLVGRRMGPKVDPTIEDWVSSWGLALAQPTNSQPRILVVSRKCG